MTVPLGGLYLPIIQPGTGKIAADLIPVDDLAAAVADAVAAEHDLVSADQLAGNATTRAKFSFDTTANWTAANPVLALHERAVDTTTAAARIGDGVTHYLSLPVELSGVYVPRFATPPTDHTTYPSYLDTSVAPPQLMGWNGTAYVSIGGVSSGAVGVAGIDVANSSGDVAAITAALTAGTSGGIVDGKWSTRQGRVARITTPTTISLGYTDTNAGPWDSATPQKVKLNLDILPDANLGAALTIKGGYGVEMDINVLGGGGMGTVTDASTSSKTLTGGMDVSNPYTLVLSTGTPAASTDVESHVAVPGAGLGGTTLYGTIVAYNSSTNVTLDTPAQTTVTAQTVTVLSNVITSAAAVAAGLRPGAVIFFAGAGCAPEGVVQPLAASVRTVVGNTFTVSEAAWTVVVSGGTLNWFDVAVRLEDMVGCKLNLYAKDYAGYALAADAFDISSKMLGSSTFGTINGNQNGGTVFWKGFGGFGSLGTIWSNSVYGDYFGNCADLHWNHMECGVGNPPTYTAACYVWFDRCNQMNNLSISTGDRASEALVKITGDSASLSDIGRFAQIRCTAYQGTCTGTATVGTNMLTNCVTSALTMKVGQKLVAQGVPDGAVITAVTGTGRGWTSGSPGTITFSGAPATGTVTGPVYGITTDGVKLVGVSSAEIGFLDTTHTYRGLHIVGGGSNGIKVRLHRSLSQDYTPLYIEPGTTGSPRVDIKADYRYHLYYSAVFASGLSAANVKLSGHLETMHVNTGAGGKYAVLCASSGVTLDTSGGLDIATRAGLLGLVNPATLTWLYAIMVRSATNPWAKGTLWTPDGAGAQLAVTPGSSGQVPTYNSDGSLTPQTPAPAMTPLTGVLFTVDPRSNVAAAAYGGSRVYGVRVAIPVSGHITCIAFCVATSGTGENFDLGVLDTSGTTRNRLDYGPGGTSGSPNYAGAALPASIATTTWVGCGSGLQFAAPSIPVTAGQQVDLFLGLDNAVATVVRAVTGNVPALPAGLMAAPGGALAKVNWVYTTHFFVGATIGEGSLSQTASVDPLIVIGIT